MNIKIQGVVTKINPTEDFTWQGTTYHYATVIVDTPAYQRFDPVAVKINVEKTPITFKEGDNVDLECTIKSKSTMTKDGREFWNTTVSVWKIYQQQTVQQQQPVQQQQQPVYQQPVQQQNPAQGVPQLNQDGSVKDNDLPF